MPELNKMLIILCHMGPKQPLCSHGLIRRKRERDNRRGRKERNGTQQGDLSYFERFEQSSGATKPDSLIIFKFISIHFVTFL